MSRKQLAVQGAYSGPLYLFSPLRFFIYVLSLEKHELISFANYVRRVYARQKDARCD